MCSKLEVVTRFQSQASCKCLWRIQILHHKGKLWSQSGRQVQHEVTEAVGSVSLCSKSQLDGASSRCTGAGAMGVCGGPHGGMTETKFTRHTNRKGF